VRGRDDPVRVLMSARVVISHHLQLYTLQLYVMPCGTHTKINLKRVPKYVEVILSRYAMRAPKGERSCTSYSFLTSAVGRGVWSASRPGRALPTGKHPRYPLYRRLGVPQSWSGHRGYGKNPFTSAGDRTPVVQSSVRH
jgi:hypothetical protein